MYIAPSKKELSNPMPKLKSLPKYLRQNSIFLSLFCHPFSPLNFPVIVSSPFFSLFLSFFFLYFFSFSRSNAYGRRSSGFRRAKMRFLIPRTSKSLENMIFVQKMVFNILSCLKVVHHFRLWTRNMNRKGKVTTLIFSLFH